MSQTIRRIARRIVIVGAVLSCNAGPAGAVPSFTRQTGMDCSTCHVSWPELTPTGRQFKLNGYTFGQRLTVPVSGMVQAAWTATQHLPPGSGASFPMDRDVILQQVSLFYAGKLGDHSGVFSQLTHDGVEHRTSIDNVDVRYANHYSAASTDVLYGFTLHNNPVVQDVYNTGVTWGFPYASSPVAVAPAATPVIEDLGQQVAGFGGYALWRNLLYTEFSLYRTSNHLFSPLRLGVDRSDAASLKGYNPYWRVALQHEWNGGQQSAMVGTYGLLVDRYPDNKLTSGPTDYFRDIGVDAQYQFLTDRHRVSAQLNFLQERQSWSPGRSDNTSDKLYELKAKLAYYFESKYGVNLAVFNTHGSVDSALYNIGDPIAGSANGRPDTSGYILELDYLPRRDMRLLLQYTGYHKFNGASHNYDGFGRNARDNNTVYLMAWLMF